MPAALILNNNDLKFWGLKIFHLILSNFSHAEENICPRSKSFSFSPSFQVKWYLESIVSRKNILNLQKPFFFCYCKCKNRPWTDILYIASLKKGQIFLILASFNSSTYYLPWDSNIIFFQCPAHQIRRIHCDAFTLRLKIYSLFTPSWAISLDIRYSAHLCLT